jgi:DNA-binding NtrC family response regulator
MAGVSASAMRLLMRHSWPGNVRELLNVVERAVAMAEHDVILPEDLAFNESRENSPDFEQAISADSSLEAVERAYIRRVLEAHGGNKAAAAKVLGITRKTLYRKLEGS